MHPASGVAPRYLTFNWHETYVHTLASIGGIWDSVPRTKAGRSDWWTEVRPLPSNARLRTEAEAIADARRGEYRGAVCHNLLDRLPLLELLEDPASGRRLGERARQTVIERFPIARFRDAWRSLLGHPA